MRRTATSRKEATCNINKQSLEPSLLREQMFAAFFGSSAWLDTTVESLMVKKGEHNKSEPRLTRRIATTLDSALRAELGLFWDKELLNPFPVNIEEAKEFLRQVIDRQNRKSQVKSLEPSN